MGITLGNFHVYKGDIKQVSEALENKYTVKQLSPNWITVLGDFLDDQASKAARLLSKAIKEPVFHFYYFDDDFFLFELFVEGKAVKSTKSIAPLLDLDKAQEKRLKVILKCENLSEQVPMLEELLGVALLIDLMFLEGATEKEFYRERDDKEYLEYLNKQKKLKIKNKTKAVLVQEIIKKNFIMREEELLWAFYEHLGYIAKEEPFPKPLYELLKDKHSHWPDAGQILISPHLHNGFVYFGDRILPSKENKGALYKTDLEGNVLARYNLDCVRNQYKLFFSGNYIYYLGEAINNEGKGFNRFLKLDIDLNIVQSNNLPLEKYVFCMETMNEALGVIYCHSFMNSTFAFDMDTLEYREKPQDFEVYVLRTAGKDGEYLLSDFGSSLYVMDTDMNLISIHRLKGMIYSIQTVEDSVYIVTASEKLSPDEYENICRLRLYVLEKV